MGLNLGKWWNGKPCVSDLVIAKFCPSCTSNHVIKNGFTANRKQQFICKSCKNRFIDFYTYKAYNHWVNKRIIQFTKEGLGIRSTTRI